MNGFLRLALILLLLSPWTVSNAETTDPRPVWVFFSERDTSEEAVRSALQRADDKAEARRMHASGRAVSDLDLDPAVGLLEQVRATGVRVRVLSRWLNAVSVDATPAQEGVLRGLKGVREVRPMARSRGMEPLEPVKSGSIHRGSTDIDSSAYGVAWTQNALIQVPELHELGYKGEGVRIGFLDSGWLGLSTHIAFNSLNLIAAYNTHDSTDNVATGAHGSRTLSMVAAHDRNNFIGVAPEVEVLLVRTEDGVSEYPAEEDYWVAGLEWVEANGAQVVSSSLSYLDWYTYDDLDGNTAVTTVTADLAASRGLLVVNSAGNRGRATNHWVGAPADGDSVLSIGAVQADGSYAAFSSRGPTVDGRIKPDVSAMGESVYTVNESTTDEYIIGSGTSYSCPAVAGVVALMLQANPDLSPMEIVTYLRTTASQSNNPDNMLGWGIINAHAAVMAVLQDLEVGPVTIIPSSFDLDAVYPNPANAGALARVTLHSAGLVQVKLFDLLGRQVAGETFSLNAGTQQIALPMRQLSSGTYLVEVNVEQESRVARVTLVK